MIAISKPSSAITQKPKNHQLLKAAERIVVD
jgi:hypothetical protein